MEILFVLIAFNVIFFGCFCANLMFRFFALLETAKLRCSVITTFTTIFLSKNWNFLRYFIFFRFAFREFSRSQLQDGINDSEINPLNMNIKILKLDQNRESELELKCSN